MIPIENPHDLCKNAAERALHLSQALAWFHDQCTINKSFQCVFDLCAQQINGCALSPSLAVQRQVVFTAIGKSALVAQLAVSMLVSVGVVARFVHPTEALHGDLGVVAAGDVVIAISKSGKSRELLNVIPHLKARCVTLFVMTAHTDSPLAHKAQHVLPLPPWAENCPLDQAPITSTTTSLALCQLLVAASLEARNFSLEQYAKNHPGGAIGNRIFIKVEDLAHTGEHLPRVDPEASFPSMVSAFTKYAKGALLVTTPQEVFLGLITEKDLRIAMEVHGPQVFQRQAKDIMNAHAITLQPGLLAANALRTMLGHIPPFNVIPLVNSEGKAVGLLHVHDLIAAGIE